MFISVYTTAFQLPVSWVINPVYSLPNYFFKIRFNIIFPSEPRFSTCSPFFGFPHLKPCRFSFLSCTCHTPLLCHVTRFDAATQWLSAHLFVTINKWSWRYGWYQAISTPDYGKNQSITQCSFSLLHIVDVQAVCPNATGLVTLRRQWMGRTHIGWRPTHELQHPACPLFQNDASLRCQPQNI